MNLEDYEPVHGRTEVQFPQLELVREDLDGIPELCLPVGYSIRHYQSGDARAWGEIMSEAFNPFWNEERFLRFLLPHFGFAPERVFFICYQGRPVGSASAFCWPGIPKRQGYIHMVGVKKEHCGLALGSSLTVACLDKLREQGFTSAMLQTEDFRIPAIKHYLRLGFKPALILEEQRAKWIKVFERMGRPELVETCRIHELEARGRLRFWVRSFKVMNYIRWLNLKYAVFGSPGG